MLNLSNICNTARGVYYGSWYTLYIVGFQHDCIVRVDYYCVTINNSENSFR